jgi:hypothetical protein
MKRIETIFYSVLLVTFIGLFIYGFGKATEESANQTCDHRHYGTCPFVTK